jgi:hypothetical protein
MINRVSRLRNTVRRPTAFWSQAVAKLTAGPVLG